MVDKHKSIFIEYCVNCSNHAWCTKHDEAKYKHFYELVQQGLEQEFQDFTVLGNCSTQTGKTIVPRLGAFEITFHDHVIFSKLKTSMWPTMDAVISRIKTVMKGGHINEYNEDDSHGKKNKHDARSARKTSTRGRERVQPPNYSYLDPHEGQARYQNGYREEFSMMEMSSKNRDESKGLPELNKMMMKRDMTPTRLEGIGMNNHFFDEKHYMKLAYLDANKRIVNLTRENQIDYLQKRYYTEFSSPIPNTKANMEYPSMNTTYSPISLQNNGNNGQNYANDDTERPIEQYRKSGSVPISKRRNRLDESGIGVPDGTMYTDKTLKTEESEQTPQAGKKELSKGKTKESKDSKDSKEMKEQEKYNKVLLSKLNDTTRLPAIANIRNQKNTLQGVLVFKGKIIQEKDLLGLESVEFPEQKFSEIKIMKDKIRKKKITMIADTNNDCKIDIYATTPEILAMEANDVTVTKGSLFKIALQFGGPECEGIRDYYLFLFKNNKPWMKILIQLSYI